MHARHGDDALGGVELRLGEIGVRIEADHALAGAQAAPHVLGLTSE